VNIPDYTVLDMRGAYIKAANNLNKHLFLCSRATDTDVHVDIIGGEIYGNRANQAADQDMDALKFLRAHKVKIIGLNGSNWVSQGPSGHTPSIIKMDNSDDFLILGGRFWDNPYTAIFMSACYHGIVVGTWHKENHRSIYLASSQLCTVADNIIIGFNNPVGSEEGIRLYVWARYNAVIGNILRNITGASSQGINITSTNCKYNRIWSNILQNVENPVTVPAGAECDIRGNYGYNPVGYISPDPTWGTSPWTFTNDQNVPMNVYISGGTVTDISKGGQSLGITSGLIHLEPDESIVITYTAAGTLKRFGL